MIRLTDASRLAFTKLRTRKVRLFITVAVAGLLFSGLAAASMVARGAFSSIDSFSKEGFGQRYLISAHTQSATDFTNNQDILNRANAIHTDLINRKKAEAKRLGIDYDSSSDRPPVEEFDSPGGKQRHLNVEHPAATQAITEYLISHPSPGVSDLKRLAEPYGPLGFYQSEAMPYGPTTANLTVLKEGKESYGGDVKNNGPPIGIDSFTQSWGLISRDLLKPFMLEGSSANLGPGGSLPVLVPYSAVEQLLQLRPLPATAKTALRLERVKEVRQRANDLAFQACYRNKSSTELLNQAISGQQELEQNKNNKDYVKPSLMYGLPKEPCGPVPIVRDVRTVEEKALSEKRRQFEATFGAVPPAQEILNYHVIGIVPDPPYFSASMVSSLINSLVGSSPGSGMTSWLTPLEAKSDNKVVAEIFDSPTINLGSGDIFYVEFARADKAKEFVEKENCQPEFQEFGPGVDGQPQSISDPFAICRTQGKPFGLMPYGSNSLALESARAWFGRFFRIAALILAVIAAIIMIGTVGRIIADSRRETAVFRAIGAKKADISLIYLIYTVCLALLISLFAVITGYLLSRYIQNRYAAEFTIQALVAYNAQDLNKVFRLQALYLPDLAYLTGLTLSAGGLSAILPLVRNLRRNPIRDMRDEN